MAVLGEPGYVRRRDRKSRRQRREAQEALAPWWQINSTRPGWPGVLRKAVDRAKATLTFVTLAAAAVGTCAGALASLAAAVHALGG